MMTADRSLIPFSTSIPSEEDLGINLGESNGSLGFRRYGLPTGHLTFLWLLSAGILSIAAMYFALLSQPGFRSLAWTASLGAVGMMAGAWFISKIRWSLATAEQAQQVQSLLLLAAFSIPTAQLLFTMVVSQDISYTTFALLLMIGYSLLSPSAESLLLFTTVTLAAWSACALRCPPGAWLCYVLPWMGAIGLSLFIHSRISRGTTVTPSLSGPKSNPSVIDVNLAEPLRVALADRDRLQFANQQLEAEIKLIHQFHATRINYLPVIQELSQLLAQDVSLRDVGQRWLDKFIVVLQAKYGAIWMQEGDQPPRLAVSTSATESSNEDLLRHVLLQAQFSRQHLDCGIPLDLGLHGKGVLLIQDIKPNDDLPVHGLMQQAASLLNLFLRWQLAEADSDDLTQQLHQTAAEMQKLRDQDAGQHTRYQELSEQVTTLQNERDMWMKEADRFQQLLETAQTEHDTLSELLDEAEQALKQLQSQPQQAERLKELEIQLQVATAAADTAKTQLLKSEQQLKQARSECKDLEDQWNQVEEQLEELRKQRAQLQSEFREVEQAWESETRLGQQFKSALLTLQHPALLTDKSGNILLENEPARALRGNTRSTPGDHPLYQLITKESANSTSNWSTPWQRDEADGKSAVYDVQINPLTGANISGYFIQAVLQQPAEINTGMQSLSGTRFFSGLAQTLEPPLAQLIEHTDSLFDSSTDQDQRRQSLLGILQHGRHVRRLLTQAIDYARLEAGEASLVKEAVNPWKLLQHVTAQLRPSAEEKGLDLVLHPAGPLPVSITTDQHRLVALIQQLIHQAIRATSSGIIVIKLGMIQTANHSYAPARLHIDIESEHVASTHSLPATFDMALLTRQSEALHAALQLNANSISLQLPVSPSELLHVVTVDRLLVDDSLPEYEITQPLLGKVLVVVDGQEQQRVVSYQLERLGLRSEVLADAERAIERTKEEKIDLILWDVEKRDIPLVEACNILRTQYYQGAILAVGTLQDASQRSDFLQAGGDGFLTRPIVLATWRHTLSMYLPDSPMPVVKSVERILSQFHADREFVQLIRSYVSKLPSHLADMRSALQVADSARFIRLTHALIDGGQLYGYPTLAEAAKQLEQLSLAGVDSPRLTAQVDEIARLIHGMERGVKASPSAGYLALPGTLTRAA